MAEMAPAAIDRRLRDLGEERIAAMDAAGVDITVLSPTAPGVQNLDPADAVAMARDLNDFTAATVRLRPDR